MKKGTKAQTGFSMTEVVIMLAFVGLLIVSTYPSLIQKKNSALNLMKVKSTASQIQMAVVKYKQKNPGAQPPSSWNEYKAILNQMNYKIQYTSGTVGSTSCSAAIPEPCAVDSPCYQLNDGSIIRAYDLAGAPVMTFFYFPSKDSPVRTLLKMDFNTLRVAPMYAFGVNLGPGETPADMSQCGRVDSLGGDPEFVRGWKLSTDPTKD